MYVQNKKYKKNGVFGTLAIPTEPYAILVYMDMLTYYGRNKKPK